MVGGFPVIADHDGRVVSLPNKQISGRLGTSENTVKVHRSRSMEKMRAQSVAELVKMIGKLESSVGPEGY